LKLKNNNVQQCINVSSIINIDFKSLFDPPRVAYGKRGSREMFTLIHEVAVLNAVRIQKMDFDRFVMHSINEKLLHK